MYQHTNKAVGNAPDKFAPIALRLKRLWWVSQHVVVGCFVAKKKFPNFNDAQKHEAIKIWAQQLLTILGVELLVQSRYPEHKDGALIVANHTSWLDIFAINAKCGVHFVAKDELSRWPVIGTLLRHAGTIFITRAKRRDAARVSRELSQRLKKGECVAFFPEGTTCSGDQLLPFHAGLFEPAILAGAPVQPVFLRYLDQNQQPTNIPDYINKDTFLGSLWKVASTPKLYVEVCLLEPIYIGSETRRDLATKAHSAIFTALNAANLIES